MSDDVPADVVANILSRLPVKPLLRFRCVSKPWCALIDCSDFVKLHLKISKEMNTNRNLILRGDTLYSVELDSLDHGVVELDHPLKCKESDILVLGSCDGLLCLLYPHQGIVLWNWSTRKYHKLPTPTIEILGQTGWVFNYKFGYDIVNDDYKVVLVAHCRGKYDYVFHSEVKVYSVKSNSWRRVKDFPYYMSYQRINGVYVSGALHWIVNRRPDPFSIPDCIAAFDLGSEEYGLVPTPKFSDEKFLMNVIDLGGRLCVFGIYLDSHVDVWVMKEYGVKESWTKFFSVEQRSEGKRFDFVWPFAFSKSGGEVLLNQGGESLVWFDLKWKTVKNVIICGLPSSFNTEICLGSLVPLRSDGGCDAKQQQEKKEEDRKGRDDFLSKGFKLKL